jgi:hypothetical protein
MGFMAEATEASCVICLLADIFKLQNYSFSVKNQSRMLFFLAEAANAAPTAWL